MPVDSSFLLWYDLHFENYIWYKVNRYCDNFTEPCTVDIGVNHLNLLVGRLTNRSKRLLRTSARLMCSSPNSAELLSKLAGEYSQQTITVGKIISITYLIAQIAQIYISQGKHTEVKELLAQVRVNIKKYIDNHCYTIHLTRSHFMILSSLFSIGIIWLCFKLM